MANLLERFQKTVKGAGGRIADYKSTISASGDFARITDIDVVLTSWNNILMTPERTYMWDPEYGSNIYRYVFEPADIQTQQIIEDEIREKLLRYDDRASIRGIDVSFFTNRKGFNVNIDVEYRGQSGQVEITIDQDQYASFLETT